MKKAVFRKIGSLFSFLIALIASPTLLYADDTSNFAYIGRGVSKIVTAAFHVPTQLIKKTLTEPPIFGTLDGAVSGAFYTVSSVVSGTLDIARGAVPYAKYAIFFL